MTTRRLISVLAFTLTGVARLTSAFGSDLWDDRPLRVVQTTEASFPTTLAAEGITEGEVRAVLAVDADGELLDYLITGYTRRELAEELVTHLRDWRYEPARQRGEEVGARAEILFAFHARGMVVSLTPATTVDVTINRMVRPALTSLLCGQSELDKPLRALHVVQPPNPGERVSPPPTQPMVVIDFYIDMEGRPRMPVVQRAAHELYAIAAIDALMQWQFEPPSRRSRPMIVRATQQFIFPERQP